MRACEIFEALDTVIPYRWTDLSNEDADVFEATFTIGSGTFVVKFKSVYYERGYWTLSFTRNGAYELTGTGSAGTVLATVMQTVRDFIREIEPMHIRYEASRKETSRDKLYPRLMMLLQREFPQYIAAPPRQTHKHTMYRLSRPAKPFTPPPRPEPTPEQPPMTAEDWDNLDALMKELGH